VHGPADAPDLTYPKDFRASQIATGTQLYVRVGGGCPGRQGPLTEHFCQRKLMMAVVEASLTAEAI